MTIVPAHETRAAEDIGEIASFQAERAILGRTRCEDHRIVERLQLAHADMLADGDIADEADMIGQRGFLVAARHPLDRLMVGRHAGADQTEGHR